MMKRSLAILLLVLLVPATLHGQDTNRAGLVVQFGDGDVQTYCVAFKEDTIGSLELLQRAGLDVIAQPVGNNAAVCKIEGSGCDYPATSCFCAFGGGQRGEYWSFWQLRNSAWSYAQLGAGAAHVSNGDVDGWAWGSGSEGRGAQPPVRTFDQICAAEQGTQRLEDTETARPETETVSVTPSLPRSAFPTPGQQTLPSNSQSLNYALFAVLLIVSVGMVAFVLRRGRS